MLAKRKLNSFVTLVVQPLVDMDTSHKEFIKIMKEKDRYKKMKGNLRNGSKKLEEKSETMRTNSVKSRVFKENAIVDNLRNWWF